MGMAPKPLRVDARRPAGKEDRCVYSVIAAGAERQAACRLPSPSVNACEGRVDLGRLTGVELVDEIADTIFNQRALILGVFVSLSQTALNRFTRCNQISNFLPTEGHGTPPARFVVPRTDLSALTSC